MKWVPAVFWPILPGRAEQWGLLWLAVSVGLSVLTLPLTIIQIQALFGFGARPVRLDYLVYIWAAVPWFYRTAGPFDCRCAGDVAAGGRGRRRTQRRRRPAVTRPARLTARVAGDRDVARAGARRPGGSSSAPMANQNGASRNASRGPSSGFPDAASASTISPPMNAGDHAVRRGRHVRDAHVPAGRCLRDDVGHQRPVDREEAAAADADRIAPTMSDRDATGARAQIVIPIAPRRQAT